MTTYIAIARNTSDGDPGLYGVIDWTVEAHDQLHAKRIMLERHPDLRYYALVPAIHFTEVKI